MGTNAGGPGSQGTRIPRGRIVVALDGSVAAEAVLPIVATIARQTGAKATVVRACAPADQYDPTAGLALLGRVPTAPQHPAGGPAARYGVERYMEDAVQRLRAGGVA